MKEWFMAGGFSMFVVLICGLAGIVVGGLALLAPTPGKIAALRSIPGLVMLQATGGFGMNMWAVNQAMNSPAFLKAQSITGDQLPFVALMGVTESAQALTLGAILATIVVLLRIAVEVKSAGASGAGNLAKAA